eukprot:GHRQ01015465.1.p2 GENE.GHRQ01015465.1~~GHRQ01015465.1.p2  ORF type:complete len:139 (+),score=61.89 GHRQ01015465.1:272-688(+)
MRQLLETQDSSSSSSGSSSREPVLFITTPGADPSQELAAFAEGQVGRDRLHEMAMGQGQSEGGAAAAAGVRQDRGLAAAEEPAPGGGVAAAAGEGGHSLPDDSLHPGFRLLLTSEAHPRFPPHCWRGRPRWCLRRRLV